MELNVPPASKDEDIPLGVCLVIGNPILDILAEVPLACLRDYGIQVDSAILAEDHHLPIYKELVDNYSELAYLAGGSGQNTVRVTQWMLSVPNSTSFMGTIGRDSYGKQLKSCMAEAGVTVHYMEDSTVATGTCAVLMYRGARSLIANLGASNNFSPSHLLTEKAKQLMESAQYVYIPGFFLTSGLDSLLLAARETVNAGKIFMMNLSAPFLIQFFQDQMQHAIPYCDILFGNQNEACTFGEVRGWGTDVRHVALKIAAMPKASGTRPRIVVITQGSNPTLVACQGKIHEFIVTALPFELVVDLNGAGDAFVGGFVACLIKNKEIVLSECIQAGHWAARTVIQQSGCSFPERCDYKF